LFHRASARQHQAVKTNLPRRVFVATQEEDRVEKIDALMIESLLRDLSKTNG